jgi:LysM domain
MERHDGRVSRRDDRWRWARVPAAMTGLVLVERVLMDEVGSPVTLLGVLGDLGHAWADPVASVLALIAFMVEALVAYVLVVLLLHSLCLLPGFMGRLAGRLMALVTPVVVRRLLDLLVGGALLAQLALATTPGAPPGHRWGGPSLAATASLPFSGPVGPATLSGLGSTSPGPGRRRRPVDATEPPGARPTPRRSAAPLPPWLGGGSSNVHAGHRDKAGVPAPRQSNETRDTPAPRHGSRAGGATAPRHAGRADPATSGYTVQVGDTLWDIAAAQLPPAERSAANIDRYWRQIYRANRPVIGADPDLIHPGTRLDVPSFRVRR